MFLRELLDVDALEELINTGMVSERKHSVYPYRIFNYTKEAQYRGLWTRELMLCRGLIVNEQDEVLARPWAKFFNLGERNLEVQFDDPVEVMDKLDGSLGILYPTPDGHAVSTRGSFESEQALHATQVWQDKYATDANIVDNLFTLAGEYTFLFEIVYPQNRIVLDYGDMDDLVLLGAVHKRQGYYYGPTGAKGLLNWQGPVAEVLPYKTISEAMSHVERPNAEGYVIRYHNYLVKLKQTDYLDLHRLKFNMNPKRVWELLSQGEDPVALVAAMPDEFQGEVQAIADDLTNKFERMYSEIITDYKKICNKGFANRREYAELALKTRHPGPLFTLADGGRIDDYIWKQLRPKVER